MINWYGIKIIVFISLSLSLSVIASNEIFSLAGKQRLLIVASENNEDSLISAVNSFYIINRCHIHERNLRIITFVDNYHPQFSIPTFATNQSGIWLLGYDGHVAGYSKHQELLSTVLDLIDDMPIRKKEILESTSACNN